MNKMEIIGRGLYLICNQGSQQKNCTVITILRQTRILHILLICIFASLMWLIIVIWNFQNKKKIYSPLLFGFKRTVAGKNPPLFLRRYKWYFRFTFFSYITAVPHGPGWSWGAYTGIFTTAARWAVGVIESKWLIDWLLYPLFSYSPTRATRDIVVEGNELEELEEVKHYERQFLSSAE